MDGVRFLRHNGKSDALEKTSLMKYLPEDIVQRIVILKEVDSTQNAAKLTSSDPPYYVVAERQTHGRGRYGRKWYSPAGGLWMTFVPEPRWGFEKMHLYFFCASLSVYSIVSKHGISAWIKWPNDIFVNSSKLCGILVECQGSASKINKVFIGIGLNVNNDVSYVDSPYKAVSMSFLLGKELDRNELLAMIIKSFKEYYAKEESSIFEEYLRSCGTINKKVRFTVEERSIEGIATGISEDGSLIISSKDRSYSINLGDVYEQELTLQ